MGRFEDRIRAGLEDADFASGYLEAQAEVERNRNPVLFVSNAVSVQDVSSVGYTDGFVEVPNLAIAVMATRF